MITLNFLNNENQGEVLAAWSCTAAKVGFITRPLRLETLSIISHWRNVCDGPDWPGGTREWCPDGVQNVIDQERFCSKKTLRDDIPTSIVCVSQSHHTAALPLENAKNAEETRFHGRYITGKSKQVDLMNGLIPSKLACDHYLWIYRK